MIRMIRVPASRAARPDQSSHGIDSSAVRLLPCAFTVASRKLKRHCDGTCVLLGMTSVELRMCGSRKGGPSHDGPGRGHWSEG